MAEARTANITELRHHLAWWDEQVEVFVHDGRGGVFAIVALQDHDGQPWLKIERVPR